MEQTAVHMYCGAKRYKERMCATNKTYLKHLGTTFLS